MIVFETCPYLVIVYQSYSWWMSLNEVHLEVLHVSVWTSLGLINGFLSHCDADCVTNIEISHTDNADELGEMVH